MTPVRSTVTSPRMLGIDVGGSAIKWALLADGHVTDSGRVATPAGAPGLVVQALAAICEERADVDAVGVAMPGVVDTATGSVTTLPNLPGAWAGFPLAGILGERVGRLVALTNDARSFALAELRLGAAEGSRDALFVTLGTGVGGAVVIGGQLYLGSNGRAGELGHQTIDPDGLLCGCGNRGCVETVASAPAVVAAAMRGLLQGLPTCLRTPAKGGTGLVTAAEVADAAAKGDPFATEVIGRAAQALGIGLANLCNVLSPERIVIGGGFAQSLAVLRKPLESSLSEHVRMWPHCPVVGSTLGLYAGAIGAALWTHEDSASRARG